MSYKRWMDNAFWEDDTKEKLNCILEIMDDVERETRQVMLLQRTNKDGTPNELFNEVIDDLGVESVDRNTEDRKVRKAAEKEEGQQRDVEFARARKLEELFNYKLEIFETEEIKNSKNRKLKGKLRRAKSKIEVNLYAMMLLQEVLEPTEVVADE
jgi:hypothetical protein|tara:strand:- start:449 stop:913 length:465 start_codon:yes stop_codon:yes gene_type:complete